MQKHEIERQEAKKRMDHLLKENGRFEKQKREEEKRERENKKRCMEEYTKMLERQDAERSQHLARIQAIQAAREAEAGDRGDLKKWMDPSLIDKQAKEKEWAALAKEMEEKKAKSEARKKVVATLDVQLLEKREKCKKVRAEKQMEKERIREGEKKAKDMAKSERRGAAKKCASFKEALDRQLKEHAISIIQDSRMNRVEKQINAKLLRRALVTGSQIH